MSKIPQKKTKIEIMLFTKSEKISMISVAIAIMRTETGKESVARVRKDKKWATKIKALLVGRPQFQE